jgi:RND family efflux transporter MFP subunit
MQEKSDLRSEWACCVLATSLALTAVLRCSMPSKKISLVLLALTIAAAGIASWTSLQATSETGSSGRTVARSNAAEESAAKSPSEIHHADGITTSVAQSDARAATKSSDAVSASSEAVAEAFTEPYRDISVAASEMGTLAQVSVAEGDIIKSGDMIAALDEEVLRASLEVARRLMSLEGTLKSAQADLDMKSTELRKLSELRDRNHASQQEVDRVETELKMAEAGVLAVQEELQVKQLECRRIEAQLEQRVVRAPIDGIVSELLREPGEFVSPSDPVIARIVQLDPLLIVFSVPLESRNEFSKDQNVELKIGDDHRVAIGIVEYVAPTPDSSNSSVRVKVRLANPDNQFQSGEPAVLRFDNANAAPSQESGSEPLARITP